MNFLCKLPENILEELAKEVKHLKVLVDWRALRKKMRETPNALPKVLVRIINNVDEPNENKPNENKLDKIGNVMKINSIKRFMRGEDVTFTKLTYVGLTALYKHYI